MFASALTVLGVGKFPTDGRTGTKLVQEPPMKSFLCYALRCKVRPKEIGLFYRAKNR